MDYFVSIAEMASTNRDEHKSIALMILGNPGVGKSLLTNVMGGNDTFESKISVGAVTSKMEFKQVKIKDSKNKEHTIMLFNLPGLIESEEKKMEFNKKQIEESFKCHPVSVVAFVFSAAVGGRLASQDIVAFNALKQSYDFKESSLLLIVNQMPTKRRRPVDYEAQIILQIKKLTGLVDPKAYFIEDVDPEKWEIGHKFRKDVQLDLLTLMKGCAPEAHIMKEKIKLPHDIIDKMQKDIVEKQKELIKKQGEMKAELEAEKIKWREKEDAHLAEIEKLRNRGC